MQGKRFRYEEYPYSGDVTIIEDRSDDKWERYLIRLDAPMGFRDTGEEFEISYDRGYPNQLWRLTPIQ